MVIREKATLAPVSQKQNKMALTAPALWEHLDRLQLRNKITVKKNVKRYKQSI